MAYTPKDRQSNTHAVRTRKITPTDVVVRAYRTVAIIATTLMLVIGRS